MNDLTPHQRDILIAMLQNKRIEYQWIGDIELGNNWEYPEFKDCDYAVVLKNLLSGSYVFRIAPNQHEAVRLYGDEIEDDGTLLFSEQPDSRFNTCYIDISHNGFIVGGKIEEAK